MNKPKISLDTNVIIFGLRKLDLYAGILRQHLFQFDVRMSAQVKRELQKNLSADEFRQFYDLIGLVSTIHIVYQSSDDQILSLYRQLGLKTGDAMIAAFCEQEAIDFLISENRHFLHELPKRSFQIIDSQTCCRRFSLQDKLH
ncbi:MAG: type II toxin-antitoxin system VapC family toxin [bacterium]|nr:type II toxin-antitoxin system VapC family toxin [bacterium]